MSEMATKTFHPSQTTHPHLADGRSARERLLASANELFYAEGVQTVGIDRIIEHAWVAKGSLYSLFGSKEGLVRAYLESRHDGTAAGCRNGVVRFAGHADDPFNECLVNCPEVRTRSAGCSAAPQ